MAVAVGFEPTEGKPSRAFEVCDRQFNPICRCRKSYPCWSGDMVVLVEDAGESISSLDGEVVESV